MQQDVREDLRCSMAKDLVTIKNESLRSNDDYNCVDISPNDKERNSLISQPKDILLDFQKKITLSKHEKQDVDINSFLGHKESYVQLAGMYKLYIPPIHCCSLYLPNCFLYILFECLIFIF